ncbi:transposase [Yinghuangia sp. ASG 101]|uniref:transposase n=1 Tax=Yinghuangia sp. ASG 101 TaxID=2896848 RepID=UPI001E5B2CB5|nr:transposase [Yinghuangia sp. ASG 101]UGQ13516.1 transposase [Yinghuangia sp. ASG 101]
MENWNSANTVLHHGKDGALTGPDREHAETSMLAPHLLQSALVHVNTPLLVRQVLAEPAWAQKLSDEDRRGLTAPFWSNVNPYGTFHLDLDKRLDLGRPLPCPAPGHRRMPSAGRPRRRDEGLSECGRQRSPGHPGHQGGDRRGRAGQCDDQRRGRDFAERASGRGGEAL